MDVDWQQKDFLIHYISSLLTRLCPTVLYNHHHHQKQHLTETTHHATNHPAAAVGGGTTTPTSCSGNIVGYTVKVNRISNESSSFSSSTATTKVTHHYHAMAKCKTTNDY
jgi:hypothetical protein